MQMANEKICDKCFKQIKNKGDYFEVITYMAGKEVKRGYLHKNCHDEVEHQKKKMANTINHLGAVLPGMCQELDVEEQRIISI